MTKKSRLSLIRACFYSHNLGAVVTATRLEVREEIDLVKGDDGRLEQEKQISFLSVEMVKVAPRKKEQREGEFVLTRREREQLKRDLIDLHVREDLTRPVNPFALMVV